MPTPYKRTLWDYSKAEIPNIQVDLQAINWNVRFGTLDSEKMTEVFTESIYTILASYIPNRVVRLCDNDPPWISPHIKSAIKCKQKVYRKFCKRGRRDQDMSYIKRVRNETSKIILNAKEEYFHRLGRKLSDPNEGIKHYWSILNRLISKKKTMNIPPLLENGLFITNAQAKANLLKQFYAKQCCNIQTGSSIHKFCTRCD